MLTIKTRDCEGIIPTNNWHIIFDRTGYKVSNIFDTKNDMMEPTHVYIEKWQQTKKPVKVV